MTVKRIKPNISSSDFASSRTFYHNVIGLDEGQGRWLMFYMEYKMVYVDGGQNAAYWFGT